MKELTAREERIVLRLDCIFLWWFRKPSVNRTIISISKEKLKLENLS